MGARLQSGSTEERSKTNGVGSGATRPTSAPAQMEMEINVLKTIVLTTVDPMERADPGTDPERGTCASVCGRQTPGPPDPPDPPDSWTPEMPDLPDPT